MEKRDFRVIHRIINTRVVNFEVCNWRDVIAILYNNKKLCKLSQEGNIKLKSQKNYVDESSCSTYKVLYFCLRHVILAQIVNG